MKECGIKLKIVFISMAFMLLITSCKKQEVISALSDGGFEANESSQEGKDVGKGDNITLEDGTYTASLTMEGGTGKAYINSPVSVTVSDGIIKGKLVWSSKNYDYMIVDGVKYLNENEGGESTFTIEIKDINEPLNVVADTVAMSTPHEIEYTLYFNIER